MCFRILGRFFFSAVMPSAKTPSKSRQQKSLLSFFQKDSPSTATINATDLPTIQAAWLDKGTTTTTMATPKRSKDVAEFGKEMDLENRECQLASGMTPTARIFDHLGLNDAKNGSMLTPLSIRQHSQSKSASALLDYMEEDNLILDESISSPKVNPFLFVKLFLTFCGI
jgi:hypothetical protein